MKPALLLLLLLTLPSCTGLNTGFNFTGEITGELKDGTTVGITFRPPTIRPPTNSNK